MAQDRLITAGDAGDNAGEVSAVHGAEAARARAQSIRQQLTTWGALWAVFGILAFMPLIWYIVNQQALKAQFQAAAEIQLGMSQLQKFAQEAASGSPGSFGELRRIEQTLNSSLEGLLKGNEEIRAAPERMQGAVTDVDRQWQELRPRLAALLGLDKAMIDLDKSAKAVNGAEGPMLELAEQILASLTQAGAPARDMFHASQLVIQANRIPQAARHMLSRSEPGPWARDLETGQRAVTDALRVLAANQAVRDRVEKFSGLFSGIVPHIEKMLAGLKTVGEAKQSAAPIVSATEKSLIDASRRMTEAFRRQTSSGVWEGLLTAILAAIAAGCAIAFTRVLVSEARGRQLQSEGENKRNQEAILRLLDEMGSLAEGDLSVSASVTEDMTGAIADSINFTVGELRGIVQRINVTTEKVTRASEEARAVSSRLLEAAYKQSTEIQETTHAVLQMARSMTQVSESASESAKVAQQSLSAAEKGSSAVQNSISGMNEIRGQIQETAKRIKRLGESSQEIDEIVELISDITEQTNVLALNAAIQAASAGEAGRGFSVVAEEVQRLAERSAQATKQISGIVKAIQADTHDAVAAMEKSTQGVVEGTRLSDAAGQALEEISEVSRDLAQLIGAISSATRTQAESATRVAGSMRDILAITEQTTEGTKLTAQSIGELSGLANELRDSVANFKV